MAAELPRFVWFDLMTSDVPAAKAFYESVVGWKAKTWPGSDYPIFHAGETGIGGAMTLAEDARKSGAGPHWVGYVSTPNADDTVKRAQSLGGKVLKPVTEMPEVGRFAVLADPQGAVFATYQAVPSWKPPDRTSLGHVYWVELNTTDWKAAWRFYSELFGWKESQRMDMGEGLGEYFMFGEGPDDMLGGMSNAAVQMKAPPHWAFYVNVKSVDATAKDLPARGGKVINGPMDVPGGSRILNAVDPQGGMFALISGAQ